MIGLPLLRLRLLHTRTPVVEEPRIDPYYQAMYGPIYNDKFPVEGMDLRRVDPPVLAPGSAIHDDRASRPPSLSTTPNRFLYLVLEGGRALRYGVGRGQD